MRVREKCKPDSEEVQMQGRCGDSLQELMMLESSQGTIGYLLLFYLIINTMSQNIVFCPISL